MHWIALFVSVAANMVCNVAFKKGVHDVRLERRWRTLWILLTHGWLLFGGLAGVVLLLSYLYAISAIPLSIAYPVTTGLSMVGVAFAGTWIFAEPLGKKKLIGISMVIAGVALLSSSGHT